jgi:hypothetical protein
MFKSLRAIVLAMYWFAVAASAGCLAGYIVDAMLGRVPGVLAMFATWALTMDWISHKLELD